MITVGLLFELAIKSLLVSGAALGVLRLTRGRSAAERSWIGHAGLIALILLVPAALMMPSWNPLPDAVRPAPIEVAAPTILMPELAHNAGRLNLPPGADAPTAPAASADAGAFALPDAGELAVWAYLVPLALLLLTMLVAVVRLSAMHRRANMLVDGAWLAALALAQQRMGFKHGTALLVSDELRSPVSWGMMRPIILLNRDAVGAVHEAEPIIAHELAHVARLDWAKLLISRLACALFWFNPLVWLLARECHQLREESADDAVLLSDVDGADYASLLVSAARHDNKALLMAAHGVAPGRDSLKRRITRVLDDKLARGPANTAWIALCVVVLLGVAGPLAALDPLAPAEPLPVARYADVPLPSTGIVQQAIQAAVPAAVQSALQGIGPAALVGGRDAEGDADRAGDDEENDDGDNAADQLIQARAVGLTGDYIREMQAIGFRDDDIDDLTGARAVGVTPEFAREMRRLSPNIDLDTVIEARAVGLNPAFYGEMKRAFPHISLDDAVGLRAVGVSSEYIAEMRQLFPRVSADQIQEMRAVGVTPAFVRSMRDEGLSASDPDEAVEGRVLGSRLIESRSGKSASQVTVSMTNHGPVVRVRGPDGKVVVAPEVAVPPVPPVPPAPLAPLPPTPRY